MKKTSLWSLSAVAFLILSGSAAAQTSLSVGDIQVLGVTADANDSFSFVLWKDIEANTVIRFMDQSFTNATTGLLGTENDMSLTFTSGLTAGTVIRVEDTVATLVNGGAFAGAKSGSLSGISNSGDQVFIYQGTAVASGTSFAGRTLLYGFNIAGSNWISTGTATSNISYLPTAINGVDANVDSGAFDNAGYTGARSGMTTAAYRAAIANVDNLTQNNTRFDLDPGAFTSAGSVSLHWDNNGVTAGNGGAGTWDATTQSRFKNGAAGTTYLHWVNSSAGNDHTAVFGGTAGTVTVSGGVAASGLQFDVTGYTLASSTITLSGTASPVIATGAFNATISSTLAGSGGFTKTGAGTLTLGGSNTGLSGTVNHDGGVLDITSATALGTGTLAFGGYNKLIARVPDGTSWTVANNMTLPATGTGGEGELIRIGDATPTAGTTLRLTGVLGGGAAGQTYTLLDSDQGSNHNNTLVLDNAANTFTGTIETWRGTLAITSDGALGNAANTVKLNNGGNNGGLRFDADNIILAATRTISLTGSEAINTQANNATINSTINGSGLRKNGAGTLTLGGANTYTGTTDIQAGTLRVTGGSAIHDAGTVSLANVAGVTFELLANETIGTLSGGGTTGGNVNLNGNTLTLAASTAMAFAGNISGAGVLTKTGTGVLTLTGTNTYGGGTNLNAGSLNINSGSALGSGDLTVNTTATGTVLQVANTATVTLANNIVLPTPGATQRVDLVKNTASTTTGTPLNLTGQISGGGSNLTLRLTTDTAGDTTTTFRFAGNNSFAGKVELFRGAIVVADASGLGTATVQLNGNNNSTLGDLRFESAMTFANNIELVNTANPDPIHTNGNTVVLSGVVSSSGDENLVKIGAGTLVLAGSNTYSVGTTISGGVLQVGNGGSTGTLGSTSAITNNASLVINRSDGFALTPLISGTGSLTQAGAGTTTVSGVNTFTGDVSVTSGVLTVGTVAASGTAQPLGQGTTAVALSGGGQLNYTGGAAGWDRGISVTSGTGTVRNTGGGTLTLTGPVSKDGSTLVLSGTQAIAVIGVISGASAGSDLVVDGTTATLGSANTYNGLTQVINGGTLVAANTTGSATGSGNVEVIGNGSTIRGTGTISPAAGGSVIVKNGAQIFVGNPGDSEGKRITFKPASGSMTTTFETGSTLSMDLFSGAGLGDNSANTLAADVFCWGGNVNLESGVRLRVTYAGSPASFQAGDTWKLLDWTTLSGTAPTGTFDATLLDLPTLTGLSWDLSALYTAGTITVMVPEPTRFALALAGLGLLTLRRRRGLPL